MRHLGTRALFINYDYETKYGQLTVPAGTCTDLWGCIELFKKLDPDVEKILVISGRLVDLRYVKQGSNWEAQVPEYVEGVTTEHARWDR